MTPPPRVIAPHEYRTMPWKNGLGATTELCVEPPGATVERFDWRLSIAELRGPGPFSTFVGYDRVIVQLDGAPMALTHDGASAVALRLRVPHAFRGEAATACDLDGLAHDFNLMVRRAAVRASLDVRTLRAGDALPDGEGHARVIYVLHGAIEGPRARVDAHHTVCCAADEAWRALDDTSVIDVQLHRRAE